MEDFLIYEVDSTYLEKNSEQLCALIQEWSEKIYKNVAVYTFTIQEGIGEIIVDYNLCGKINVEILKQRINMLLDRFNIAYKIN